MLVLAAPGTIGAAAVIAVPAVAVGGYHLVTGAGRAARGARTNLYIVPAPLAKVEEFGFLQRNLRDVAVPRVALLLDPFRAVRRGM